MSCVQIVYNDIMTQSNITLPIQFAPILSHRLSSLLQSPPIILALGSDKHTIDCFGPLTGHFLKAMGVPTIVYGCLRAPLNSHTLPEIYPLLNTVHKGIPILAVDSMIGNKQDVGKLKLVDGGIFPGSGIGKDFPLTGNVSLTAIITDKETFATRQAIGLGQVHQLAISAAKIIYNAIVAIYAKDVS